MSLTDWRSSRHLALVDQPADPPVDPEVPVPLSGAVPSHGLFVVRYNGKAYGYQVSDAGQVQSLGTGNDIPYLDARLGAGTYVHMDTAPTPATKKKPAVPGDTTWSTLKGQFMGYVGDYSSASQRLRAIVVVLPPVDSLVVAASYIFDGSFQHDADGDKFRDALASGSALYFVKP